MRVGIHGRNDTEWQEDFDFYVIQEARIEAVKMMGHTSPGVFYRLKKENHNIELITRLYDVRFGVDSYPSAVDFANRQTAIMAAVKDFCTKFEIHNEPNHPARYEGWGITDEDANDFNDWFLEVYRRIKEAHPWASLGFPGLAIPHRDLEWAEICRPAIEQADWLGVHCYWQTPPGQEENHLADAWGLRFKAYHEMFPNKRIEITECGNSNAQANPPIAISEGRLARQTVEYYAKCAEYDYVNAVCFFILSSPDPSWESFAWRDEHGRLKPVIRVVRDYKRPAPIKKPTAPPAVASDVELSVNSLVSRLRQLEQRITELEAALSRVKHTNG